ncbi:unnamed protein product, partial [Mesorhabditis spiculigera]
MSRAAHFDEQEDMNVFGPDDEMDAELTMAQREVMMVELAKLEEEIAALKQALTTRRDQATELRRKLGIAGPIEVISHEANRKLQAVLETPVVQKTTAAASAGAETVRSHWLDLKGTAAFKAMETSVGSALNTAASAAKSGYSHLAGYNTIPGSP